VIRGPTERATAKDKALPIIDRLAVLAGRTLLEESATLRDVSAPVWFVRVEGLPQGEAADER
jgi:hypothetical protein